MIGLKVAVILVGVVLLMLEGLVVTSRWHLGWLGLGFVTVGALLL